MTYKWYLIDWRDPQRVVVGELTEPGAVHRSASPSDGDTNVRITPNGPDPNIPGSPDYRALLRGHVDGVQDQTVLECEINVGGDWQDHYEDWVRSMIGATIGSDGTIGSTVTAQGIWVEDLGHSPTNNELHPMDLIFGSVPASKLPGDWIGELARQRGLVVGQSMFGYRFAVASDDREGEFQSAPPLAPYTRPVTFTLPFPPRPAGGVWNPSADQQLDLQANATIDTQVADDGSGLDVTVTCVAVYDDPAAGAADQGPGVLTGEIVTYWSSPSVPQIVLNPEQLSFGSVPVRDVRTLNVRIQNVGQADLVISASPPPAGAFSWAPLTATTIAPGGSLDFAVDFKPTGVSRAQGTLFINSNAPSSPSSVTLKGTGTKQIHPL